MNKIIFIALAATSAIAAAAPAAAQSGGHGGYGQSGHGQGGYGQGGYGNVEVRADQLQMRLQAGVRSGAITRAEAMPLREQLRQLVRLETLYARDGISGRERADLQHRINSLRQGIRMAERSGGGRFDDRYDRGDDRSDRADDRYDRDDDRYDRDGRRDGRWDENSRDDRDGRDGRWDDDDRYDRDSLIGLRVGQRASADLGGLPYAYRSQFRDGNGVYYRSDGRQIYQIDARTQMVLRVYPLNR